MEKENYLCNARLYLACPLTFSFNEDGFGQAHSSGSQYIFPLLFYLSCLPSPILAYLKGFSFLFCFFISLIFSQKQITFSFGAEDWTPALRLSTPSVTKLYPSQGTWHVHITYLTHSRSSRNYLSIMSIASKKWKKIYFFLVSFCYCCCCLFCFVFQTGS